MFEQITSNSNKFSRIALKNWRENGFLCAVLTHGLKLFAQTKYDRFKKHDAKNSKRKEILSNMGI